MRRWLILIALTACTQSVEDVQGPFTGDVRRFAVDHLRVPANLTDLHAFGDDLDGNGTIDNQVGNMTSLLAGQDDLSSAGDDMIAAGAIASSVLIQANDLANDRTVGVTFVGADGDGSVPVGGVIDAGRFTSNRTRTTTHPGSAVVHLPVFADTAPTTAEVDWMQLDLAPDGSGGYTGHLQGGIPRDMLAPAIYPGIREMFERHPGEHRALLGLFDTNHDYQVDAAEVASSVVVTSWGAPDLDRHGLYISVGIAFHLVPCDAGRCAAAPRMTCDDRVSDGDETDVDCGGSCLACPGGRHCTRGEDCASGACDAATGTCAAPSCGDQHADGFETDVDCGGPCGRCASGQRCWNNSDCTSQDCVGSSGFPVVLGRCS